MLHLNLPRAYRHRHVAGRLLRAGREAAKSYLAILDCFDSPAEAERCVRSARRLRRRFKACAKLAIRHGHLAEELA